MNRFAAGLLLFFLFLQVSAKEKPGILILHFTELNNAIPSLGLIAENTMSDLLSNMGCIRLVDKSEIQKNLDAEGIQADSLTEDKAASLVGKLSGVDYIISGCVSGGVVTRTLSSTKNESGDFIRFWHWESKPSVRVKILNAKDGKVVYSDTKTWPITVDEELVESSSAFEDVANMVRSIKTGKSNEPEIDANQVKPNLAIESTKASINRRDDDFYNIFRPSGVIISIEPENEKGKKQIVTIDLGTNFGVKNGNKFEVLKINPPIKHPTTGEMIQGKETVVMELKIKSVDSELSTAVISKKELDKIAIGMIVRAEEE